MTKKTHSARSVTMASIHEAAESLRKVKAIDRAGMRAFDKLCLTPRSAQQQPKNLSVGPSTGQTKKAGEASL